MLGSIPSQPSRPQTAWMYGLGWLVRPAVRRATVRLPTHDLAAGRHDRRGRALRRLRVARGPGGGPARSDEQTGERR